MNFEVTLNDKIDPAELVKLARIYADQENSNAPIADAAFSYAHGLIRSSKDDVRLGIDIFDDLISRDDINVDKEDCLFHLALAHTRLKEYDKALSFVEQLLKTDSSNQQTLKLKELIRYRQQNDVADDKCSSRTSCRKTISTKLLVAAGGGLVITAVLIVAAITVLKRR